MPERAYTYAVPRELRKKYAFRRYGFHGTSMRYVAPEAARILGKPLEDIRMIIAHLGNGASITAIRGYTLRRHRPGRIQLSDFTRRFGCCPS
ncbi:acetate kinase AckA [Mycobacteroides abscessus subsp. massiliense]|nr:acetate kinase AckA [Mycobacteroides abscessus subsp. massiliense]